MLTGFGGIATWLVMAAATISEPLASARSEATRNEPWHHDLTSARRYDNPDSDITVRVEYAGPDGQTMSAFGVWMGDDVHRIQAAFPTAGEWTWRVRCSDPSNAGLHGQSGVVTVKPYEGDNPLYLHGPPKVADDHRHLAFADGTPFLWIGDTAWVAPLRASFEDWRVYVDDRVAKGFSVIQIAPASHWGGRQDVKGNRPFLGEGLSQWNPAYWREFERKVRHANDRGLMVLVVGVMEPVSRYPSVDEAALFARNLAGLLAGDQVFFSPSFDSSAGSSKTVDEIALGNAVGVALRDAALNSLITQHPGTNFEAVQSWHAQPYLDFIGVQSGHNRRNYERVFGQAASWVHQAYQMKPTKPVINLEALYAADGLEDQVDEPSGTATDARHTAYLSMLSGAAGVTYGASGLWNWETDEGNPTHWRKALAYPSSTQIGQLGRLFRSIAWWTLIPRPNLIPSNLKVDSMALRAAFAMSDDGKLGVAYLPPRVAEITLDVSKFSGSVKARWFNPQTGRLGRVSATVENQGERRFSRPDGREWDDAVLLLEADGDDDEGTS